MQSNLLFFDTETTGLQPPHMVEFACLLEGEHETLNFMIKPPIPMNPEASAINGITDDMLKDCEPIDAYRESIKGLVDSTIPVAHNMSFDKRVLELGGIEMHPKRICTMKMVQRLMRDGDIPKMSAKLEAMKDLFGMTVDATAHTAAGDVLFLQQVFWRLAKIYSTKFNLDIKSSELLDKLIEISAPKEK